jgi:ABC-type Na+ transport system ATPase subunit NatA
MAVIETRALSKRYGSNRGIEEISLQHLSRGNRQKIGLIQALFHSPELLLPVAGPRRETT